MSFGLSILLLTIVCFICLLGIAETRRKTAFVLAIVASVAGYNSYMSHKQVLGQPVKMTWEEMPSQFTVNFFRIIGDRAILLWLTPDQLVMLPYHPDAQEALEGERENMGNGMPSTFGEGEGGQGGSGEGEGEGQGQGNGQGDGGEGEQGNGHGGWGYELKGSGGVTLPGSLPPK